MSWKDLNITLKAELIKLGIRSGIKDINLIRQLYDNVDIKDYLHPYYTNKTVLKDNILSLNQDNTLIKGMIDEFNKNKHNIPQLNIYTRNGLGTEKINTPSTALFLLFKGGGYISNNPIVSNVKQYGPGGYTNNQPISYKTWKDYENLENTKQKVLEGLAMLQYADNKATYGDDIPEEAKYLYDMGLLPEIEVTADRDLTKKESYLADLQWRNYLATHPIQIGSEEYNRLPEKAKAQVYKNKVTDAIDKAALPTAAAIIAPTAIGTALPYVITGAGTVASDWSTLSPILKEFGKQSLISQMGYDATSAAYRIGTGGRDLLTDTGNFLFPNVKNQFIKNTLAGMANPGGWLGVPKVYGKQILNNIGTETVSFLDSNPITRILTTGDPYTTISGKFGYYGNNLVERIGQSVKRRLGIKTLPKHPEFLRKIDPGYITFDKNGNLDLSAGSRSYKDFLNFTTDRAVVSHNKGNWDVFPELIINPKELSLYTPISIEPSDTFFRKQANMVVNPKHVTLVSGNIKELNKARSAGMDILSSYKLRHIYKKMLKEALLGLNDRFYKGGKSKYGKEYTKEIQRLTTKRGSPDINDYKYMENLYGIKSGVTDIKDVNIGDMVDNYKKGLLVYYPNNSLWGRHDPTYVTARKYNKVFYDPASSVESDYIKKTSVPQLYSELHNITFKKHGGYIFPKGVFLYDK